jgi:hypothetical protein
VLDCQGRRIATWLKAIVGRQQRGYQVILRKMDTVETTPLTRPVRILDDEDVPDHLLGRQS